MKKALGVANLIRVAPIVDNRILIQIVPMLEKKGTTGLAETAGRPPLYI